MTIDEIKTDRTFLSLGTQQRDFVVAYCSNGADKIAAAFSAYQVKDERSATAIANRALRHPIIKALVGDFLGLVDEEGTRQEFLAILWRRVRDTTDAKVQLGWATLYMKVKGYEAEKPEPADSPVDSVDDLVRQLEEKGKV